MSECIKLQLVPVGQKGKALNVACKNLSLDCDASFLGKSVLQRMQLVVSESGTLTLNSHSTAMLRAPGSLIMTTVMTGW